MIILTESLDCLCRTTQVTLHNPTKGALTSCKGSRWGEIMWNGPLVLFFPFYSALMESSSSLELKCKRKQEETQRGGEGGRGVLITADPPFQPSPSETPEEEAANCDVRFTSPDSSLWVTSFSRNIFMSHFFFQQFPAGILTLPAIPAITAQRPDRREVLQSGFSGIRKQRELASCSRRLAGGRWQEFTASQCPHQNLQAPAQLMAT